MSALLAPAAVFAGSTLVALRVLFPRLSAAARDRTRDGEGHVLPREAPAALRQAHAEHGAKSAQRRAGAWAFSVTVGLAATLGALVMAEIAGVADARARNAALGVTVPALLLMLVVVIPWMECRVLLASAGGRFQRAATVALFAGWLGVFWAVGRVLPPGRAVPEGEPAGEVLMRACLERIGVVGICLMALLSGFAAVSAPWHTFAESSAAAAGGRPVTEADVNRKQGGLDATSEMLATKRHRLRLLEAASSSSAAAAAENKGTTGRNPFVNMVLGTLRGASGEEAEVRALRVEIAGLTAMEASLASSLSAMRTQRAAAARAATPLGRIGLVPARAFAGYCVYRVLATALTTARRASSASPSASSFSGSDPISRLLGLLARHWDPALDQLAWARVVSFALSGGMLAASAGSAVQTLHLLARWAPGLLRHAQAVLALGVGQVAATYVISAGLLLRSQLPGEARVAVGGVLRGALTPGFVDGWFEGWFLVGSVLTALGLWIGRRLAGDDDWDDYAAEEMGAKRS